MICFAGILESHLVIDGHDVSIAPGGFLYETARAVRSSIDPRVGVLARLGNDGPGRITLEALVHDRLLFDPFLVSTDLPSYLVVKDRQGRTSCYSSFTGAVSASSQELLRSLDENSDVNIIVMCAGGLYHQPLFGSLLDAATFHSPRAQLVLDVASSSYDHPENARLVRQIRQALESADTIVLEESDLDLFEGEDIASLAPEVFLLKGGIVTRWYDGDLVSTAEGDRLDIYRQLCSRMS